ncbi:hypothetical protein T4E_9420 [Trichinella pseudospiralis]|uniref:Uncharacterized protein n=1 Tax=Trichinella pseudospiralis TaxID=6337 RepID=A0A0V0XMA0_TRIPS|nr:hypothetical protein T4E_9420 [Trichinella pseudospiralis]
MSVYGSIYREPCLLLRQLVPLEILVILYFLTPCPFKFASMYSEEALDYVNSRSALRLVPATLSRPLSAHSKCGITEFMWFSSSRILRNNLIFFMTVERYANAIENI